MVKLYNLLEQDRLTKILQKEVGNVEKSICPAVH